MPNDIAPELWARIDRLIKSGVSASPGLRKPPEGYSDAQIYAARAGRVTSRALVIVLQEAILPDGRLYFNIADRTVRPALQDLYGLVADACAFAQQQVNHAAGLGIKAIRPELNDSRIRGIIDRLSEAANIKDVNWLLKAPVVNFAQSVVDDSVQVNADFAFKSGLQPKIVRTSDGTCCPWCDSLVGSYNYPVANTEVFRRHENCNCVTTYYPISGASQNVWTKALR